MCTILKDASGSQVLAYNEKGVEFLCGGTYKIVAYLDMLENQPYSKVTMELASDKEAIKGVIGKNEFFTAYDNSELVFCVVKKLIKYFDSPLTTYLDIDFSCERDGVLSPEINFSVIIMPRYIWRYWKYIAFFGGLLFTTTVTYFDKIFSDPILFAVLFAFAAVGSGMTTIALGQIRS